MIVPILFIVIIIFTFVINVNMIVVEPSIGSKHGDRYSDLYLVMISVLLKRLY